MPAGRPPKPTALHLLHGTARPSRLNPNEPAAPVLVDAKPPAWLKGRGRKAWPELSAVLVDMGVLTVADRMALALLCDAYGEYVEARELVRREGQICEVETRYGVTLRRHPAVDIAADAYRRVAVMMGRFGLTPADRAKVSKAEVSEQDPFEAYLNGRGTG